MPTTRKGTSTTAAITTTTTTSGRKKIRTSTITPPSSPPPQKSSSLWRPSTSSHRSHNVKRQKVFDAVDTDESSSLISHYKDANATVKGGIEEVCRKVCQNWRHIAGRRSWLQETCPITQRSRKEIIADKGAIFHHCIAIDKTVWFDAEALLQWLERNIKFWDGKTEAPSAQLFTASRFLVTPTPILTPSTSATVTATATAPSTPLPLRRRSARIRPISSANSLPPSIEVPRDTIVSRYATMKLEAPLNPLIRVPLSYCELVRLGRVCGKSLSAVAPSHPDSFFLPGVYLPPQTLLRQRAIVVAYWRAKFKSLEIDCETFERFFMQTFKDARESITRHQYDIRTVLSLLIENYVENFGKIYALINEFARNTAKYTLPAWLAPTALYREPIHTSAQLYIRTLEADRDRQSRNRGATSSPPTVVPPSPGGASFSAHHRLVHLQAIDEFVPLMEGFIQNHKYPTVDPRPVSPEECARATQLAQELVFSTLLNSVETHAWDLETRRESHIAANNGLVARSTRPEIPNFISRMIPLVGAISFERVGRFSTTLPMPHDAIMPTISIDFPLVTLTRQRVSRIDADNNGEELSDDNDDDGSVFNGEDDGGDDYTTESDDGDDNNEHEHDYGDGDDDATDDRNESSGPASRTRPSQRRTHRTAAVLQQNETILMRLLSILQGGTNNEFVDDQ